MDRWKYLWLNHREHVFCNPLSARKVDELVELLRVPAGGRVLDIACGKAEFLCRAVERWQASGVGVDVSPYCVADARERVAARGLDGRIEIVECEASKYAGPEAAFDATSCLGATWIWKDLAGTLGALARWTKPGGMVAVGDVFWRKEPSPEHLAAPPTVDPSTTLTHPENIETGTRQGLVFLYAIVASPEDWDRYNGLIRYSAETWAADNPDDPDTAEVLQSLRGSRMYGGEKLDHDDVFLRWGRDEVGWGVYLFRKPSAGERA